MLRKSRPWAFTRAAPAACDRWGQARPGPTEPRAGPPGAATTLRASPRLRVPLGGLGPGPRPGAVTLGRNRPRSDPRAPPRPFRVPENSRGRRPSSTAQERRGRSSQPGPLGPRDPRIPGPPDCGAHLALAPPPPPPRQTPPAASAGTGGGASGGVRGPGRPGRPARPARTSPGPACRTAPAAPGSSRDARPAFAPITRRCFPRGPASNSTSPSDFPVAGPDCLSAVSARTGDGPARSEGRQPEVEAQAQARGGPEPHRDRGAFPSPRLRPAAAPAPPRKQHTGHRFAAGRGSVGLTGRYSSWVS